MSDTVLVRGHAYAAYLKLWEAARNLPADHPQAVELGTLIARVSRLQSRLT